MPQYKLYELCIRLYIFIVAEKYHAAKDVNTQALMLKVPYAELDVVIEYLRAKGYAGHDMPSTCAGIEEYYAEKRTA